ncbi:MAG: epoxide hydrolase [Acidobacteria bacterium]|nr:epoxide hydrolase [Acidobacteriota bacterium]MBI3489776.1 epoxide hydrolase [Acidobacteriota bacterium]
MSANDKPVPVLPFRIHVPDEVLSDLRARILRTRWPEGAPGAAWEQGADLTFLKGLLGYWAEGFDWRSQELRLNGFRHFRAELEGVRIHFVHERARQGNGIPLILTHGWPSSFHELLPLVPLLTDPKAHGIEAPAFDLVIPSLPGYGFSERPARATYGTVACMWHQLMRGLGYERYGAGGGDFGAGVATYLAIENPAAVMGLHLTTMELWPPTGEGTRPLTEAENRYVAEVRRWEEAERGYSAIQSTKPQTLGYALNDSPAGLAAWILEKWRAWSDSCGDLEGHFSRDFLLTMLTIYWATETITPGMRDYFDNRWHGPGLQPGDRVRVPTGFACFDRNFVPEGSPPREWVERLYEVRRWTPMPRGGHFGPAEEPERLARDIAAFFAGI